MNSSQRQLIFYKYIYITTVQCMYIAFSNFWPPHTQVGELGLRIITSFRDFFVGIIYWIKTMMQIITKKIIYSICTNLKICQTVKVPVYLPDITENWITHRAFNYCNKSKCKITSIYICIQKCIILIHVRIFERYKSIHMSVNDNIGQPTVRKTNAPIWWTL